MYSVNKKLNNFKIRPKKVRMFDFINHIILKCQNQKCENRWKRKNDHNFHVILYALGTDYKVEHLKHANSFSTSNSDYTYW